MSQPEVPVSSSNRRVVWFLVADVVQRVFGLTLLMFLIRWLPPAEFARYGLFSTALTLGYLLLTLTLPTAPIRLYFDCTSDLQRSELLSTVSGASLVLLFIVGGTLLTIVQFSGGADRLTNGEIDLQLILLATILGFSLFQFVVTLLRVLGLGRLFFLVSFVYSGLQLTIFSWNHRTGSEGFHAILGATLVALFASGLIGLGGLYHLFRPARPSWPVLQAALSFSGPQVIHGVSLWAVNASGTWIGTLAGMTLDEIAPFTLLNILFQVVAGVTTTLFQARTPELGRAFAAAQLTEARALLWNTTLQACGIIVVGYLLGTLLLHSRLLPLEDRYVLPPELLGCGMVANLLHAWYLRGYNHLSFSKKTGRQALGTCLAGALTLLVTWPLASAWGTLGLATALTVGTFFQALASNAFARPESVQG